MDDLYRLKISRIIGFTLRQSVSFKLLLLFLVFEYLRPQGMYPGIRFVPWSFIILVLCTLSSIAENRMFRVSNRANVLMFISFVVVTMSSLFAISPQTSFQGAKTVFTLALIYYLVINIVDSAEKMFVFVGFFILLTLKLSQFVFVRWVARGFTYDKYGAAAGSAWLQNSGELAIQMCMVFAISTYFAISVWPQVTSWFKRAILVFIPVSTAGSVLASGSRGSFVALAVVVIMMWLGSKRRSFGLVAIILLVFSLPIFMSERDLSRTKEMGGVTDTTASNRLARWGKGVEMVKKNPLLGVGYQNWAVADAKYFDGEGQECHNIFIECASELGFPGLFVFVLLIIACFRSNFETIRTALLSGDIFAANLAKSLNLALIAYLVAGCFVTVLYYPYFWVNLAMSVALNNITSTSLAHE